MKHEDPKICGQLLAVDDEAAIRNMLCEVLSLANYRVDLAENGQVAIAKLQERRYDAVLLDLKMPHTPGHSVLEAAGRMEHCPPIIVMTGGGGCDRRGIFATLIKPFGFDQLLCTVRSALAGAAAG